MKTQRTGLRIRLLVILAAGLCATAGATSITYSGSSGIRSAEVVFDLTGTNLTVTLTNTSVYDVLVPDQVLTAVFFDYSGPALTPVSALVSVGSTVAFGPSNGGNVGGEWAYAEIVNPISPGDSGISSSGFGLFGAGNFDGPDLQNPASVDGLQYGLTSAGDDLTTGNAAVTGQFALIKNSAQMVLTTASGFQLSDITNVSFQYGTALSDPNVPVPEPASLALVVMGLIGFVVHRSRKNC